MALEVLGRISFLLHSNPDKVPRLKSLTSTLSVVIRTQLADKKSISILLRDMRPFLNKINESNVNIITFALSSVVLGDKTISDSSWLDISKTELFCFYSDKFDLYLKIPFNLVVSCVTAQPRVLEVSSVTIMWNCIASYSIYRFLDYCFKSAGYVSINHSFNIVATSVSSNFYGQRGEYFIPSDIYLSTL